MVIGQVEVADKTNEIPMLPMLCDQLEDLTDMVVTAMRCTASDPPHKTWSWSAARTTC